MMDAKSSSEHAVCEPIVQPVLELWQLFAITPLEKSEALRMMTAFAVALEKLHKKKDLWDHCEKGVFVHQDSIEILGTVSNRDQRLNGALVDPYRSIAPPEYIHNGVHDVRSDVFAWGVIAYELITGDCPIKGETIPELIESATRCAFLPPSAIRKDWPERLDFVVMRALSKEASGRYQTMGELLDNISIA